MKHCRQILFTRLIALCIFGLLIPGLVAADRGQIGGDFELIDHNGQPFSLRSQRGKIVLMFFGYTSCPDICPAELSSLAKILRNLDEEQEKIQALFVTVDPTRDTPSVIKDYVQYFHPGMIGLTGSENEINKITQLYNVQVQQSPDQKGNPQIDHAANLYVINPQGKLSSIIPYGLPSEHVISVIHNVLNNSKQSTNQRPE